MNASAEAVSGRRTTVRTRTVIVLLTVAAAWATGWAFVGGSLASTIAVDLLAVGVAGGLVASARRAAPGRKLPWVVLAVAIAMWVIGDVIWDTYHLVDGVPPTVSWADVPYLSSYPLLIGAVCLMIRLRGSESWREGLADGLAVAVLVGLAAYIFLVVPSGGISDLEGVVAAAYPLVDALVIGTLIWLTCSPGRRGTPTLLLMGGMVAVLAIDIIYAVIGRIGGEVPTVIDHLYPVAYLAFAMAGLHRDGAELTSAVPDLHPTLHRGRVVLMGAALLGAPLVGATADGNMSGATVATVVVTSVVAVIVLMRFLGALREIEASKSALAHQALHDGLTGLMNRTNLMETLEVALDRLAVEGDRHGAVVVFSCDLDRFKPVNDTFGHSAGDELLVAVGERLLSCVRTGDAVGRMGGDEFCIIARMAVSDCDELARRIVASLSEPFALSVGAVRISASVGVAVADRPAMTSAEDLLRAADDALYAVKRAGRNGWAKTEATAEAVDLRR
jgi:diguanylate cyclase (GGDEF)-like protein